MFLLVGLYFFKTMNKYSQSKKSVHKCFTIIKKVTVAIANCYYCNCYSYCILLFFIS